MKGHPGTLPTGSRPQSLHSFPEQPIEVKSKQDRQGWRAVYRLRENNLDPGNLKGSVVMLFKKTEKLTETY